MYAYVCAMLKVCLSMRNAKCMFMHIFSGKLTLMMTSAQVVETSVNVTNNSPLRDYSHPDDQTTQTTETPGFKPFTVLN